MPREPQAVPRAGAPGQHRGRAVGSGLRGCSLGSPGPPHPAAQPANGSCRGIPVPTAWLVAAPSPASPGPLCLQVPGSSWPRHPRAEQEPGARHVPSLGSPKSRGWAPAPTPSPSSPAARAVGTDSPEMSWSRSTCWQWSSSTCSTRKPEEEAQRQGFFPLGPPKSDREGHRGSQGAGSLVPAVHVLRAVMQSQQQGLTGDPNM